jgi:hypothetical protein
MPQPHDTPHIPDTLTEPAREVPVAWRGDLCVIGGSCTGVFAAVPPTEIREALAAGGSIIH